MIMTTSKDLYTYLKNKLKFKRIETIIVPTCKSDLLQNNKIEDDLQSMLRPLNFMQNILLYAKYSIRNNHIYCNTYFYNCFSLLSWFIYRCFSLIHLISVIKSAASGKKGWGEHSTRYFIFASVVDYVIFVIGDLTRAFLNITQSQHNVSLILKIQHVLEALQINKFKLKYYVIFNWSFIIFINSCFIVFFCFFVYTFDDVSVFDIFAGYISINHDTNIMFTIFFLKLMTKMLRVWIKKVENSRNLDNLVGNEDWNILFDVFANIQEAYTIVDKSCRLMITYYTLFVSYLSLRNVSMVLCIRSFLDLQSRFIFLPVATQMWNMKNIAMVILLAIECENFYAALRDVESTCVMFIQARHRHDPNVCKNVLRVQRAMFHKMSACGFFDVDAQLPLQLCSFLTSYTIVLLQFAYL
nr:uncharacterized protein LOC126055630 [Helicoverpa armigera]